MTTSFDWKCQPQAEKWMRSLLEAYKEKSPFAASFEKDLSEQTSTRLFDWIDHFTVENTPAQEKMLEVSGFEQEYAMPAYRVFYHPGAKLPRIVLCEDTTRHPLGIAVKVESISDFLMIHQKERHIEGSPLSPYRRALVDQKGLLVVERRGSNTMDPCYTSENYLDSYLTMTERWQTRPSDLEDEEEQMHAALILAEEMVATLGKDNAAWIVLECERKYWQARNTAAQLQKNRQDRLGMGWANHDHHTFRSSRRLFAQLVRLFETLGFHCRERYYAGADAGWGAQIMENPICGLILFLDVDLAPEELEVDFAHHHLPYRKELGTVGLWCALHGDSILKGGMHHLEAQFSFDLLKEDLNQMGVQLMDPFSNFPYLRQAFTKGEMWKVSPDRVEKLVKEGQITHEEADRFLTHGALGSHLENLERNEGYKGFNKDNVSLIIKRTDPRH